MYQCRRDKNNRCARRGIVSSNTEEKPKRPRGRPKSIDLDQRQADIIESGTDVFIELGYANTTVDIIAARCGISKRTFYDFYEAKGDLLSAAIKARSGSIFHFPEADAALDVLLGQVFYVDADDAPSPANMRQYFLIEVAWEATEYVPQLRQDFDAARAELASWLRTLSESGKIIAIDADAAATMLIGIVFGSLSIDRTGADLDVRAKRTKAYLRSSLKIFANGLLP
ncbi:TetR/AcrR family transcriptional regulator [Rhizobium sp. BG4]|nr:TetR/AcrR family transcriptional regulator [Rhizobium sp. BG4]